MGPRYLHTRACGRHVGSGPKRCDETTVARAREGYGDALGHGGRETRQEFLGRSLSRTTKGFIFGLAEDYVKQLCTDFGFGELKGANILVCRETPQR